MNHRHLALLALCGLLPLAAAARLTENFDAGWRFQPGDNPGAEQNPLADTTWPTVTLPHDWSIAGPFAETNLTGGAGAFLPSGIGWYRKHFTAPARWNGQNVTVQFDGVLENSDAWINGFHLGHRPNGYVSFSYDLTGHLNWSGDNVLAVRADTSAQPASRWYSGAGIYRHVRLVISDPIHIVENGVFVSTPEVSTQAALVRIATTVTNQSSSASEITVRTTLLAPGGKSVATIESTQPLAANNRSTVQQSVRLPQPHLWNLEDPALYQVRSEIRQGSRVLDDQTTTLGIRDAHFEADTGFWLNGKNFKLHGVALHHDGGAFGAAVPLDVWAARLKNLRALGVNAIRTAHNPPAPEFLDLCDRLGFVVMDEFFDCWTVAKNPYDYHLYFEKWSQQDERDTILRDRNHPSVIIYSVGNEIHDTPKVQLATNILRGLVQTAHETDPTRPVTQALFRPNVSHDYTDGLADMLDVVGQNYRENEILAAHEQKPTRKILGTENTHIRQAWVALRDNPPYAGQFLWTGIDYLGESRRWPIVGHGSGLLDRTGAIRPLARERQSWWSDAPMVAIARRISQTEAMPTDPGYGTEEKHTQVLFADWTPANPKPHKETVEVYSNVKEVELFLNDHSLGVQTLNADAAPRVWQVPFAPGTLRAVARAEGQIVATDELKTAGPAAQLVLTTEDLSLENHWDGVAIIRARITDAQGVEVPRARDMITFHVTGPGVIAAVDNGDNASHELFQTNSRHAYQGEATAFVKTTGKTGMIYVTATAPGLTGNYLRLKAIHPHE